MPYTIGLLGSIPRLDDRTRGPLTPIEGNPPWLLNLPVGCPFVPRCPMRIEVCSQIEPGLDALQASGPGHAAACHRSGEIESGNLTSTEVFPVPPRAHGPEAEFAPGHVTLGGRLPAAGPAYL
jgi:peptide/nickel transport system ATP-binding protein